MVDAVTTEWIRNPADERAAAAGMVFRPELGEFACNWIERNCCLYEGHYAGQPIKLYPAQRDFVMRLFSWVRYSTEWGGWIRRFTRASLWMPKKNGKALALDTVVPTPQGWRDLGDLEVGDELFDETGEVCRVAARTEVMYQRPCYEVMFSDGTRIVADAEHLWRVESFYAEYEPRILTTRELAASVDVINSRGEHWAKNHRIPVAGAVQCPDVELPIKPYTLGVWLGDGDSDGNRITTADSEVLASVGAEGYEVSEPQGKRGIAMRYRIGGTFKGDRSGTGLKPTLRSANLLDNKHIPDVYKFASERQRLELLRGLMDTDGTASKKGQCVFTTTRVDLAIDVAELVASLGWKPLVTSCVKRCQTGAALTAWNVTFYAFSDRPCFTIARKVARLKPPPRKQTRSSTRHIVAVRPVDSVPVRCIEVDSPSKLFLVTRSFIATHNSPLLAAIGLYLTCKDGEQGQKVYMAAKNGDQAKIAQRHAFNMVEQSPALLEDCKLNRSTLQITHLPTRSAMLVLTGDDHRGAKSKEGINGSILIDECHVFDREMHERTSRAGISRREPLNISVSTAGDDPSSYGHERCEYGRQVNNGSRDDLAFLHVEYTTSEKTKDSDIDERLNQLGKDANPAWQVLIQPTEFRADWNQSKGNPREVARFKQYRLNIWVGSTNQWLDVAGWEKGARDFTLEDMRGRDCYLGLDLSRTRDMTAAALLFPWPEDGNECIRVWPMFWLPESIAKQRDHLFPFQSWNRGGFLTLTPGDVVDYGAVEDDIVEVVDRYEIRMRGLYFDQHYAEEITQRLAERMGMATSERVAVRQSLMYLSPLAKEWERRISRGVVHHPGNAVMDWQVGHVEVWADRNQNIRPVKPESATGKSIDGIMAALDAMAGIVSSDAGPSVYESRGLVEIGTPAETRTPAERSVGWIAPDDDDEDTF